MCNLFNLLARGFTEFLIDERGSISLEGEGEGGEGATGGDQGDDGGGADDAASKAAAEKAKAAKSKADDKVERADHERALADLQKYKKEAKALKDEKDKAATEKLKAENKWKEIAEANETKAKEADERAEKLQGSFLEGKRFDAARLACEKLGIRAEAVGDLDALDLKDIQIETTSTGKINVLGADKFAERLKTLKPHWFTDKRKPNVNTRGNTVVDSDGPITAQQIVEAEKAGRKSGDMKPYYDLHKQFQNQRAAARR